MTSFKQKIFLFFLGMSLVLLIMFCAASFWGLFSIREQMQKSSANLGEFAAANSSFYLEVEVLDKLMSEARGQSLVINERLADIAKDTRLFSNFVTEIYKQSGNLPVLPVQYSTTANNGILAMHLKSANGRADYERIRKEVELLGNVKALFESYKGHIENETISVFLGTESGFHISYDRYSHDNNQVFDPRARPWYIGAKRAGKLFWTAPYAGISSGKLVITCSNPFYNLNGEFMGVAGIDVLLEEINSEIANIDLGVSGFAFILDSERNLVLSSNLNMSGDAFNEMSKEVTLGAAGFRRIIAGGDEMLIAYSPIPATDWSFATVRPVSQIMRMVTENYMVIENMTLQTKDYINSIIKFTLVIFIFMFMAVMVVIAIFSNKLSAKIAFPVDSLGAELNIAASIQSNMLPGIFPAFPNRAEFDIYAIMQSAKEVGGDFYDFFMVDANTLAVVMADVSGKGVPAALFMVIAKTLIKHNAQSGKSPQDVFINVNNILCENNEAGMFVTAFMGYLDLHTGKFTYINAGHNPPFIKQADGVFNKLPVKSGVILAGMEDMQYRQDEIMMGKDDILFLYTDGVTEAFNNKGEIFTEDRLIKTINKCGNKDLNIFLQAVKNDIALFAKGAEQADDIAMLALEYKRCRSFKMKEITIEAEVKKTDFVLDFIGAEMEEKKIPAKLQNKINTACEEIFVNIAYYAYTPSTGNVIVRVDAGNLIYNEVVVEFEDSGVQFNPLEVDGPDITAPIEDRDIGGLGVFMVKKLMDTVEYRYENGKNILRLSLKTQ